MLAIAILYTILSWLGGRRETGCLLLRVISGVGEDSWVKAAFDVVKTFHDNPMVVSIHEFIIKYNLPLLVKKIPVAMGQGRSTELLTGMLSIEVLELVRELERIVLVGHERDPVFLEHEPWQNTQSARQGGGLALLEHTWNH
jgi:hypothetical protein